MYCGIELIRNGKLIDFVSWDNWNFDHFVGEYLLMVRRLPYALDLKNEPVACRLRKKVLQDLADVLEQQKLGGDQIDAAQYVRRLRELAEKYLPGDQLRYCSEE